MTDTRRIRIDALSYGAHGVGRLDGKAVFVRGVVPGEEVDVVVREDHGRYAYADLVRIEAPAAERRTAPCPYVPRCGGCPWQHIDEAAQRRAKERNVRDALVRIAHWADPPVVPVEPAGPAFQCRSRLSLRTAERRVGFYAAASHELVAIDHCMLARPAVDAAIAAAADLVRRAPDEIRRIEILSCERSGAVVLDGEVEGSAQAEGETFVAAWLASWPQIAGVALHGRRWRRSWGHTSVIVRPESDLELTASAGSFTQVNPEANRHLVRRVLDLGAFAASDRVLDFYAGIGNLSLPIARRSAHVLAVEQSPWAAADARANARAAGMTNLEIVTATARRALESISARPGRRIDAVVLDPPRSGAAEAIDAILRLAAERLVYVSCNPATLARDLARLRAGYEFDRVEPIDLFPQTYHVETVARGRRKG